MPDPKLVQAIAPYIEVAKTKFPTIGCAPGTEWDAEQVEPNEARLFAYAALYAIDQIGFKLVSKREET